MIKLDNHDSRIRYVGLVMVRDDLENIPQYELPEGYRFVFYREGDRDAWIEIERSAKELADYDHGVRTWERYYGHVLDDLDRRMLFIENAQGEKVATATAFFDPNGGLPEGCSQMHWVAVRRDHQGKGLARPLISQTLRVMKQLGHTRALLTSQTNSWVAVKLYLQFGFRPEEKNALEARDGWRIIRTLTQHPAVETFEPVAFEDILTDE